MSLNRLNMGAAQAVLKEEKEAKPVSIILFLSLSARMN